MMLNIANNFNWVDKVAVKYVLILRKQMQNDNHFFLRRPVRGISHHIRSEGETIF